MKTSALVILIASMAFTACDSKMSSNETIRREGQPDFVHVPDKDPEMDKAIQTARDSADTFIAALKAPSASQANFTV